MTTLVGYSVPLSPRALSEGLSYTEAIYHVCRMIQKVVSNSGIAARDYSEILHDVKTLEELSSKLLPHLRAKEKCRSVQEHLEYFSLRLHTSFVISALCRPALSRRREVSSTEAEEKSTVASLCKEHLTETVRMYLKMHALWITPTRSWSITHNGLSSALLLGILGETKTNPEVRKLQGDLIDVLSAKTSDDSTNNGSKGAGESGLVGGDSRALAALKKIYDFGWPLSPAASKTQHSNNQDSLEQEPNMNSTLETAQTIESQRQDFGGLSNAE